MFNRRINKTLDMKHSLLAKVAVRYAVLAKLTEISGGREFGTVVQEFMEEFVRHRKQRVSHGSSVPHLRFGLPFEEDLSQKSNSQRAIYPSLAQRVSLDCVF